MSGILPSGVSEAALSQPKYKVKVVKDVYVEMRDGVHVCVDLYLPDAPGRFPALYAASPYQKDLVFLPEIPAFHERETNDIDWFVQRGYAYVHVDIRGAGKSVEGIWQFHSKEEQNDHYDLIEWIAKQDWCAGRVGGFGESYYAWQQWFAAATAPPHLATIVPFDGGADMYRDVAYHGGLPNMSFVMWWHYNMRAQYLFDRPGPHHPNVLKWDMVYDVLRHPTCDEFWQERSADFKKIKCPVYSIGFWHKNQLHLRGNIRGFEELEVPKKLLVCHGTAGEEMFVFTSPEMKLELLRWYDHWLKGIDTGIMEEPPVKLFVANSEEGYRVENEWPLARTEYTKFYLQPGRTGAVTSLNDGGLSRNLPTAESGSFEYEYPSLKWGGWSRLGSAAMFNGLPHPTAEILTFTSDPLKEDLEITGPITMVVYASSTETNADFYVRLVDQEPDERQREDIPPRGKILSHGCLRATYREKDPVLSKPYRPYYSHRDPKPIEPGVIYKYEIEVSPVSNVFKRGHRIRIDLANADSAAFGSAHHYGLKVGKDRICFDRNHPSHIILPVIPR